MTQIEPFPNPVDIALGARIRARRNQLRLSQEQLARQIGVTFQQIQKYEHGANRVSFSRLVDIAYALTCGVGDLIGDLGSGPAGSQISLDTDILAALNTPGAHELLADFAAIPSGYQRKAVRDVAQQFAGLKSSIEILEGATA